MDVILVQKLEPVLSLIYKATVTTLLTSAIKPFKVNQEAISIKFDVLLPNGRNLAAGIPYCACLAPLIRCRAKRTRKPWRELGRRVVRAWDLGHTPLYRAACFTYMLKIYCCLQRRKGMRQWLAKSQRWIYRSIPKGLRVW